MYDTIAERINLAQFYIDNVVMTPIVPLADRDLWTRKIIYTCIGYHETPTLRMVKGWVARQDVPRDARPSLALRKLLLLNGYPEVAQLLPKNIDCEEFPFSMEIKFTPEQVDWINKIWLANHTLQIR